ncbi:hypothetical protein MRB53_028309 [Persea americana]|uniref:Uncharacterized protein n=1 Tax=Persea americana TaxID=3435 RepID=A0ACC2KFN8_PERAE|nr:hypothetical protein MRB53_028309 [Persea americana]
MEGQRLLSFLFFLPLLTYSETPCPNPNCTIPTSACGSIQNISYPFLLKGDQKIQNNCTRWWYELTCVGNTTTFTFEGNEPMSYSVANIFYENQTLRLVDHDLANGSCPPKGNSVSPETNMRLNLISSSSVAFLNCSGQPKKKEYHRLNCTGESQGLLYFHVGKNLMGDLPKNCGYYAIVPVNGKLPDDGSFPSVQKLLQMGFELSWPERQCQTEYLPSDPYPYNWDLNNSTGLKVYWITGNVIGYTIIVRTLLGVLHFFAVIIFVIYRKFKSTHGNKTLNRPSLGSARYSYSEIRKITDNFKVKLGQGGYGAVFKDHSIATMSNARGTAGYIAPELFSTNFGRVSYKSDVYSYGMLLLEMAGRRKNYYPLVERESQIYFPTWVYDELTQRKDIDIGTETEDEKDIAKKLVIIGLWCIQIKPNDRPSMSRVVEMLEQNIEELEMPPKPFLASPERLPMEDLSLAESDTKALLV